MRFTTLFPAIMSIITMVSYSPAEPWDASLDANLMLNQNGYSDNWSGGETGTVSWAFNSNLLAKKELTTRVVNRNTLKLSFGQTHNQNTDSKSWEKPFKSTDLIDFESLFRFKVKLKGFVDPYTAVRIETQFLDASDPARDRMFNPAKFTESIGAVRALLEEENRELTIRTGFGFRQYVDRDVLVNPISGKRETQTTHDGGIEFVADFITPLAKERITYTGKLSLFQALYNTKSTELEGTAEGDYWKEVDVNWENIIGVSVTKYVIVNLYTQILYDKQIDLGGRFKQTMSLGLTYKFI